MTCLLDMIQELFREVETVRAVRSETINTGPCFLFNAVVAADNDQDLVVSVYDGVDTAGSVKLDLYGAEDKAYPFAFFPPVHFRHGIYVAMEGDILSVTLTFLQDVPRKSRYSIADFVGQ